MNIQFIMDEKKPAILFIAGFFVHLISKFVLRHHFLAGEE